MVTRTGRAKILDFGLTRIGVDAGGPASMPSGDVTETEDGLRSGTVPYMSPEQALGSPTDFHTDQFSFGLILYEMLAGRPAFRRDTPAATLHAIINDDLPPMVRAEVQELFWCRIYRAHSLQRHRHKNKAIDRNERVRRRRSCP